MTLLVPPLKVLVIDTETTGLPYYKSDPKAKNQPWPVQIGAVLMDLTKDRFDHTMNTLMTPPEGAFFHPKAVETHGLSEEMVRANGRDPVEVMLELRDLAREADVVAAYNFKFDEFIIRSASERVHPDFEIDPVLGEADPHRHACIMQQTSAFLGLTRWIKLEQAYETFKGVKLQDAHDALADTVAAAIIFKEIILRTLTKV